MSLFTGPKSWKSSLSCSCADVHVAQQDCHQVVCGCWVRKRLRRFFRSESAGSILAPQKRKRGGVHRIEPQFWDLAHNIGGETKWRCCCSAKATKCSRCWTWTPVTLPLTSMGMCGIAQLSCSHNFLAHHLNAFFSMNFLERQRFPQTVPLSDARRATDNSWL